MGGGDITLESILQCSTYILHTHFTHKSRTRYPYTGQIDTMTQAKYLSRMWLTNTLEGVPSIWCKFLSGTGKATSSGDMLGVVRAPYETAAQPHAPKPAYLAARTLHAHLRGAGYCGRISANFAKPMDSGQYGTARNGQRVEWRGRVLPVLSANPQAALGRSQHNTAETGQQMVDPDGISVMYVLVLSLSRARARFICMHMHMHVHWTFIHMHIRCCG